LSIADYYNIENKNIIITKKDFSKNKDFYIDIAQKLNVLMTHKSVLMIGFEVNDMALKEFIRLFSFHLPTTYSKNKDKVKHWIMLKSSGTNKYDEDYLSIYKNYFDEYSIGLSIHKDPKNDFKQSILNKYVRKKYFFYNYGQEKEDFIKDVRLNKYIIFVDLKIQLHNWFNSDFFDHLLLVNRSLEDKHKAKRIIILNDTSAKPIVTNGKVCFKNISMSQNETLTIFELMSIKNFHNTSKIELFITTTSLLKKKYDLTIDEINRLDSCVIKNSLSGKAFVIWKGEVTEGVVSYNKLNKGKPLQITHDRVMRLHSDIITDGENLNLLEYDNVIQKFKQVEDMFFPKNS